MYAPIFLPSVKSLLAPAGCLLVAAGLALGYYAFTIDVSSPVKEVVSLQLLSRQICLSIFATGIFIGGVVLVGFGQVKNLT